MNQPTVRNQRLGAALALFALLMSGCSGATPRESAASTGSVRQSPSTAREATTPASVQPTQPTPTESTIVGAGEDWVVFQSLADQFNPRADRDGIDHDDTIFLVRTDGTGLHRLPPADMVGSEIRPSWSANGEHIAFIRGHLPNDIDELWTIDADGTNAEHLFTCLRPCNTIGYPQWAPDGSGVYFNLDADAPADGGPPLTFALWKYSLATHKVEAALTRQDGMTAEWIRLSPDGAKAVFIRAPLAGPNGVSGVYVADLKSGKERRLTHSDLHPAYPDWSTTDRIAFNSYDLRADATTTEAANLYTLNADGTDLRQITTFGKNDTRATQPRWAQDGLGIVFTLVTRDPTDPFGVRHLAFIAGDGTGERWLTPQPIVGTHPELRPLPGGGQ
jgi:Tol biopolymer transport system component